MRHNKKINHLGRTAPHRKAMLANMASSLILHKRINTTVAKAKALRKYVEPLITKSKLDNTHARRVVFSYLQDKEASKVLFNEVSEKVMDRNGGYTRIIKLGNRLGDNAEMAMIELVDYNTLYGKEEEAKGKAGARKSRRRRGGKKSGAGETQAKTGEQQEQQTEATVTETEQGEEKQAAEQKEEQKEGKEAKSTEGKKKASGGEKSKKESSASDAEQAGEKEKKQSAAKSDENKGEAGNEEQKDAGSGEEGKQSDDDNAKNKE